MTDHLRLQFRQTSEQAIPHPDDATIVVPRFVTDLGQRAGHGHPQAVTLDPVGAVPSAAVGRLTLRAAARSAARNSAAARPSSEIADTAEATYPTR
jgi:hypothetical protein